MSQPTDIRPVDLPMLSHEIAYEIARTYWYGYLLGAFGCDPDPRYVDQLALETAHHDRFDRPARRLLAKHHVTA